MINYKPKHGDMEMWMICAAIGSNHELIDKMKKNDDRSYPIIFSVGALNWISKEWHKELMKKLQVLLKIKHKIYLMKNIAI